MIMHRMIQRMQKLYEGERTQVFFDEITNMELYVIESSENAYKVMGLDPDSGECGWLYMEQGDPGLWDTEEGELLDIAMMEAGSHERRIK